MAFSLCTCIPGVSLSLLTRTPALGLGPTQSSHFNLIYLNTLSLNIATFCDIGIEASAYEFWGNAIQSITKLIYVTKDIAEMTEFDS